MLLRIFFICPSLINRYTLVKLGNSIHLPPNSKNARVITVKAPYLILKHMFIIESV